MLVAQVFIPVYFTNPLVSRSLSYLFMSLTLISSLLIFKHIRKNIVFKIFIIFVIIAMFATWIDFFLENRHFFLIPRLLIVAGLYVTIFINIFKEFSKRTKVDLDFLLGAICAYILLGILGSFMSVIIDIYYPVSFNFSNNSVLFQDYIYFNFVTLTTLGYGDALPVTPQGEMHSVFIAVVGQLYLTITIALIVGRYLMHESK
jgi:hypothetical protein